MWRKSYYKNKFIYDNTDVDSFVNFVKFALSLLRYVVLETFIILNTFSLYFKRKSPLQVLITVISKIYGMNELLTVI